MRRMLSDTLRDMGVDLVGTASDGREALELCARLGPDVMTLDPNMPGFGGLDVEALSERAAEGVRTPSLSTPLTPFSADLGAGVLAQRRVAVRAKDTGGSSGRSVEVHVQTGQVFVRGVGGPARPL